MERLPAAKPERVIVLDYKGDYSHWNAIALGNFLNSRRPGRYAVESMARHEPRFEGSGAFDEERLRQADHVLISTSQPELARELEAMGLKARLYKKDELKGPWTNKWLEAREARG